jgi:hypothetical protein
MERRAFSVEPMHPIKDKRARLRVATRYIKTGAAKFAHHDVDALVYLILGLIHDCIAPQEISYV